MPLNPTHSAFIVWSLLLFVWLKCLCPCPNNSSLLCSTHDMAKLVFGINKEMMCTTCTVLLSWGYWVFLDAVLTSVTNEPHKRFYFWLLQRHTEALQRWQNGRTEFGGTLSLFMFVIGLMMKTYYRMWLEKMKWAHVLALKCEKQKTTSFFFFLLELTSSMWYVALIRCTTLELTFTQHVTEILRSPDTLWNIV